MVIAGYCAAILIGISLGLIGGGGSILTVPVLVYLLHVPPVTATAYSLFIVGATSLVGGVQKYREGNVDLRSVFVFGLPSVIAVYCTRLYIIPSLPEEMFRISAFVFTRDIFIMTLFAILMVMAAASMIYQGNLEKTDDPVKPIRLNIPFIAMEGVVVGVLTGLVGAGGGFLIIPALVLYSRLPMRMAIGTSLVIIACKSLIGFIGDLQNMQFNWMLLIVFSCLAIAGIFAGNIWSRKIHNNRLKQAFGIFVLIMGIYIIIRETVFQK